MVATDALWPPNREEGAWLGLWEERPAAECSPWFWEGGESEGAPEAAADLDRSLHAQ